MKVTFLEEPDLEFASGGRHIDPRHGLADYGPADVKEVSARIVRAAIIGPRDAIEGAQAWLDRCRNPIPARSDTGLSHLYVPFPGFEIDRGFRASINWNSRLVRAIPKADIESTISLNPLKAIQAAVDLYDRELGALSDEPHCDVVIVCRPDGMQDTNLRPRDKPPEDASGSRPGDFHALLKAKSLQYKQPIQILRRSTWDATYVDPGGPKKARQDESTRAWNLHTALYYKNGGVPWRLPRDPSDLSTCYVGVSFYRTADDSSLQTSVAQVFNQRGDGVIVRGGQATVSKEDRQPHLSGDDACGLLLTALQRYRFEHRTTPARVVVHKSSDYTDDEIAGFRTAGAEERLDSLELLWITDSDGVRLFRRGQFPPLRGTLLSLDERRHVLYSRGSVPFYQTYPGMYVPQPIGIRTIDAESSPEALAREILALTKMNWNQTQLDGRDPITLRTARTVGAILRHVGPEDSPSSRYAHYM